MTDQAATTPTKALWRIIGSSSRGASHLKSGLPNQDAISFWLPESGVGPPAILAIADGHGSPQHFRSATGSELAVEAATALLLAFAKLHTGQHSLAELETDAAELPKHVVENWHAKVAAHLALNPFRDEEFSRIGEALEAAAEAEIAGNPTVAYGATLLVVLMTNSYAVCLQIGDGDILFVDDAGKTTRPVPADARLMANQTTSLCQVEAWKNFRLHVESPVANPPALVLISTDGYANSFASDQDFLQIGSDFLDLARDEGLDRLKEDLPSILKEASEKGSGDDVTFGIMRRGDGEEEAMADYVPRKEYEIARSRIVARIQEMDRRVTLIWWMLVPMLALAVASLALTIASRYKVMPGASPAVTQPSQQPKPETAKPPATKPPESGAPPAQAPPKKQGQ
jgi:serine/threonine protein phosphatase PrpC